MRKVLVTGASGFIGRHVVRLLQNNGWEVHAVGRRAMPFGNPMVTWHKADLLAPAVAAELVRAVRPTHLVHLAWYAEPGRFWSSPVNLAWVEASLRLAIAFAENGGVRLLGAGTCAEYDWQRGYLQEELTPTEPRTPYGVSKDALRRLLMALGGIYALEVAWGRVFFLYGPDEAQDRLVSSVAVALLAGRPANCSSGRQVRDFLHVEDVASAFVRILEADVCGAVNIGSANPVRVRDLVSNFASHFAGGKDLLRFGALPQREDEPALLMADNRRLLDMGWVPRYTLDSGLAHTARWWLNRYSAYGSIK